MKLIKYTDYDKLNRIANKNVPSWILMDEIGQWQVPTGKSLSIFGNFFYMTWDKYFFWFRLFGGYGLHGRSNKKKRFILFSERMGITKTYKVFGWTLKILKPSEI